jgi:hypothetical protein
MSEQIDVLDLLGDNKLHAHSSVIMTFGLDLPLYDGLVQRQLRSAGVSNQIVLCDGAEYQNALTAVEAGAARSLGRSYTVTPVFQGSAFHPKAFMLLGRDSGRLLVGSGNVTFGGLARNAELFGVFDYTAGQTPHPAFAQVFKLAQMHAKGGSSVLRRQLKRAEALSPWLAASATSPSEHELLIGGPGHPTLLEQIRERLPGPVDSVLVVGSSFDRGLLAIKELADLCPAASLRCIVQQDSITLDGATVSALGSQVDWRPFVDPYPDKKDRPDAYAHAKLLVVGCGSVEVAVYGSANPSRPGLLGDPCNTELMVISAPQPRGHWVAQLGLTASLESPGIRDVLTSYSWPEEGSIDDATEVHTNLLAGAVWLGDQLELSVTGPVPGDVVAVVSAGVGSQPLVSEPIGDRTANRLMVLLSTWPATGRLVHLATDSFSSNHVAVTYPEAAEVRGSSGLGGKTEAALAAMHDGRLLGTVLFELLCRFKDFEVVFGQGGGQSKTLPPDDDDDDDGAEKETASFYTDKLPGEDEMFAFADRTDLDLLVTVVKPEPIVEDCNVFDDEALEEEAERREIDKKYGKATGAERQPQTAAATQKALEKAARRVERRLKRSAQALDDALEHRKDLPSGRVKYFVSRPHFSPAS